MSEIAVAPPTRVAVMDEATGRVARTWASAARDALHLEGRASAGCFAGTLTEAHARLGPHLRAELARHGMDSLSRDEIDATARDVYRKAKKVWHDLQR